MLPYSLNKNSTPKHIKNNHSTPTHRFERNEEKVMFNRVRVLEIDTGNVDRDRVSEIDIEIEKRT